MRKEKEKEKPTDSTVETKIAEFDILIDTSTTAAKITRFSAIFLSSRSRRFAPLLCDTI
jgi:hypothetical protein